MALYSRRPKLRSSRARGTKLYQTDDDYLEALLKHKQYKTASDALADLVNEAIRIRRAKDLGKDETLYAVKKSQEEVVHNGTKRLVERLEQIGDNVRVDLGHHGLVITDLAERISLIERQTSRNATAINRLLEITTICYGILRHYILGIFVLRLTKTKFEDYAAGFTKRLAIFRTSVKAGNLLLEGEYEKTAEGFAQGLAEATGVKMPRSNQDQAAMQALEQPVVTNPFDVLDDFPRW